MTIKELLEFESISKDCIVLEVYNSNNPVHIAKNININSLSFTVIPYINQNNIDTDGMSNKQTIEELLSKNNININNKVNYIKLEKELVNDIYYSTITLKIKCTTI